RWMYSGAGRVEKRERRLPGQGARYLEPPLLTVGQLRCDGVGPRREAEQLEQLGGLALELSLVGDEAGAAQERVPQRGARAMVRSDADVVAAAARGEEPDVLEGAG